jgi:hypothetical protein
MERIRVNDDNVIRRNGVNSGVQLGKAFSGGTVEQLDVFVPVVVSGKLTDQCIFVKDEGYQRVFYDMCFIDVFRHGNPPKQQDCVKTRQNIWLDIPMILL